MSFFIDFRFLYLWLNNLIDKFFRVSHSLSVIINILTISLFHAAITEDDGTWSENDDVVSMETMSSNPTPVPGTCTVLIKAWELRK